MKKLLITSIFSFMLLQACVETEKTSSNQASESDTVSNILNPNPNNCKTDFKDVWLSSRLSCLNKSKKVILDNYETGKVSDIAFTIGQKVLDKNFNNILGSNGFKAYKHLVCIKNVPKSTYSSDLSLHGLSGDLTTAFAIGNFAKIDGVSSTGVIIRGFYAKSINKTIQPYQKISCNDKIHPVIIDYSTGYIVSINENAMNNVIEYIVRNSKAE